MPCLSFRSAALLLTAALPTGARAADPALLDLLLENGAITAEQRAALSAEDDAAETAEVHFGPDGFEAVAADGRYALEIGARLHADWSRHRGDDPPAAAVDGTEIRRARIGVAGRLDQAWHFAGEADFADDDAPIKDFWLRYAGWDDVSLTFGHQKQPYSLALEMSSNDIPFVERGIDNALISPFVDRAIGVRADTSGERWFAAAGLYGESTDGGDEGWGTSGRLVFAPVAGDERVVHIGIRAAYREPDAADDTIRIRDATTHVSSLHIVDSGPLSDIDSVTLLGPEGAFALGALSLLGEYTFASVERVPGDLDFEGWHLAATWTLGGESRAPAYRLEDGEFKRLRPARTFSRQGGGTWELAARIASIDLNDGGLAGGSEKRLTFGANWYANRNVRLQMDWSRVVDTDGSSAVRVAAEDVDFVTLRAQVTF